MGIQNTNILGLPENVGKLQYVKIFTNEKDVAGDRQNF